MEPAFLIQSVFILSAAGILFVNSSPSLRGRFVAYGARESPLSQTSTVTSPTTGANSKKLSLPITQKALDVLASIRVPHAWFLHFYVVSILSSLFWALQIIFDGPLFRKIAAYQKNDKTSTMSSSQVGMVWLLMAAQGARRLYESTAYMKPSSSTMWIGHWAVGLVFYLAMGLAVWVEGSSALLRKEALQLESLLSLKTCVALPLFIISSGVQRDCHAYLASLPKYSIPRHPAFSLVLCPHYTMECLIYFSLALIAAPPGQVFNRPILAAFVFTLVNLSVTAGNSRKWYIQKFGSDSTGRARAIIPYVY